MVETCKCIWLNVYMSLLEFARRFAEPRHENKTRSPAVFVVEFGGGSCNKAGEPSCRDFCAVPEGKKYNPLLDPPISMLADLFPQIARLKPAIVSLVPNGEGVDSTQNSNTLWKTILRLKDRDNISQGQFQALDEYYQGKHQHSITDQQTQMSVAEKTALSIAMAKNADLNVSLTTNGSFLNADLLKLYGQMGLTTMNLSYHPNRPFNPTVYNPDIEHLISRAQEAIDVDIIPTITHVLTSKNADTFISLADYITEHDIFFAVGIANGRGANFSTTNISIEPTDEQVKMVFRRLLARKLFADRSIRTTIPYLLFAPYLKNSWMCDQSTDFFHISVEPVKGRLLPKLNVCSEVRPDESTQIKDFLTKGSFNIPEYLKWRDKAMQHSDTGCKTCIHQCWFEAEARGGVDLSNNNALEWWDYWDTTGKALRQLHTFRHPIRPTVSDRKDFQKPYLWESLLQGCARVIAERGKETYWQETFRRSFVDFNATLASCIDEAANPEVVKQLAEAEKNDGEVRMWNNNNSSKVSDNWHDAEDLQSRMFRGLYLTLQKSGKEAEIALPLKFRKILRHESDSNFRKSIETIIYQNKKKASRTTDVVSKNGTIFPLLAYRFSSLIPLLSSYLYPKFQLMRRYITPL